MRARTITIAIGVAAAGVMALGAQTATALPARCTVSSPCSYGTKLWMQKDGPAVWGHVYSQLNKCERRRRVVLFERRPGADRRLLSTRSEGHNPQGYWRLSDARVDRELQLGDVYYAKVRPKVRDRFVCLADHRSNRILTW